MAVASATAAITLLWMLGRIFGRCGHKAAETTAAALSSTIVFLLYPSLTQTLFSTFNSVEFNAGNGTTASFLAADAAAFRSFRSASRFAMFSARFASSALGPLVSPPTSARPLADGSSCSLYLGGIAAARAAARSSFSPPSTAAPPTCRCRRLQRPRCMSPGTT